MSTSRLVTAVSISESGGVYIPKSVDSPYPSAAGPINRLGLEFCCAKRLPVREPLLGVVGQPWLAWDLLALLQGWPAIGVEPLPRLSRRGRRT